MPVEPSPTRWRLPDPSAGGESDVIAIGGDLEPGTLVAAYRQGLFPMRIDAVLAWWSPDPRGIVPLDAFHVSRTLRKSRRRFDVSINRAFRDVMERCADPRRAHGWIDASFLNAYTELHRLGWAHSVEVWQDGALAGGLYGVRIASLFAGESMFHHVTDASKVALWATVELLRLDGGELFDVQWTTPHLRSLGAIDVSRVTYLRRLAAAVA